MGELLMGIIMSYFTGNLPRFNFVENIKSLFAY